LIFSETETPVLSCNYPSSSAAVIKIQIFLCPTVFFSLLPKTTSVNLTNIFSPIYFFQKITTVQKTFEKHFCKKLKKQIVSTEKLWKKTFVLKSCSKNVDFLLEENYKHKLIIDKRCEKHFCKNLVKLTNLLDKNSLKNCSPSAVITSGGLKTCLKPVITYFLLNFYFSAK